MTQYSFVRQPLRLEVYRDKLKPIAGGRSKKLGGPVSGCIYMHSLVAKRFRSTDHPQVALLMRLHVRMHRGSA